MSVYKYQGDFDERELWVGTDADGKPITEIERLPRQFILGIPARDLTEEDWAGLDEAQRKQALEGTPTPLYKQVGAERAPDPERATKQERARPEGRSHEAGSTPGKGE